MHFDPMGSANSLAANVGAFQARIVSAELSPMEHYHELQSYTHNLNIQNTHAANLDVLSSGGNNFAPGMLSKSLGGAITTTSSRGVLPLLDSGNREFSAVKSQYARKRFAFMINIEYRAGLDMEGAMTLFGYTDRHDVVNGVVPPNLIFTVNMATIYRFERTLGGKRIPHIAFAGRVNAQSPLAPVLKDPTQFQGGLHNMGGFGGMADDQGASFGSVGSASIAAHLALQSSCVSSNDNGVEGKWTDTTFEPFNNDVSFADSRLTQRGISGNSFDNSSAVRMLDNLCTGFTKGSQQLNEQVKQNQGKFIDDESRELFGIDGNASNGLQYKWQMASICGETDSNFGSCRVVTYIKRFCSHFDRTARCTYKELCQAFKDLDRKMEVQTSTLHKDMEMVYGMKNDPLNHNSSFIESSLARMVNQMAPSIIASLGFQRFSFQMTNRNGLAMGFNGSKDRANPLSNISHPFFNRNAEGMRKIIQEACNKLVYELGPILGDHGHRQYELEVHYMFRGDCRIRINCGGTMREFNLATFCDSSSAASNSFHVGKDRMSLANSVEGLMNALGTTDQYLSNQRSDWGAEKSWGDKGDANTNTWGDSFKPTTGIKALL